MFEGEKMTSLQRDEKAAELYVSRNCYAGRTGECVKTYLAGNKRGFRQGFAAAKKYYGIKKGTIICNNRLSGCDLRKALYRSDE